jgi:hypothetical protein
MLDRRKDDRQDLSYEEEDLIVHNPYREAFPIENRC